MIFLGALIFFMALSVLVMFAPEDNDETKR